MEKELPNQDCFSSNDNLVVIFFLDTTPFVKKYWDLRNHFNKTETEIAKISHPHKKMQRNLKTATAVLEQKSWSAPIIVDSEDGSLMCTGLIVSCKTTIVGEQPVGSLWSETIQC